MDKKAAFEWVNLVKKLASHFYRNKTRNNYSLFLYCRSPLGLRGFKYCMVIKIDDQIRRSPLGLRGFKFARVAWVTSASKVAAHSGCVDLNLPKSLTQRGISQSQPTRAAWI